MKIKNIFNIILIIILIIFICFLFKYISIAFSCIHNGFTDKKVIYWVTNAVFKQKDYTSTYKNHQFVPAIINENCKKKPIIIFGCSYVEGIHANPLKKEDKFSYKLYEETNRSIYNRAYGIQGLQYMLYQLEDENTYKELPEPEYIIYVFINDHTRRLYKECCLFNKSLFYKRTKDGKDIEKIKNYFYYTYPAILIRNLKKYDYNCTEEKNEFLRLHFIKAKQLSDKHWPNAKWIILLYDEENTKLFDELKKYGFEIALAKDFGPEDFLTNLKYRVSETDPHPTKEAWQVLTPPFAKRYIK